MSHVNFDTEYKWQQYLNKNDAAIAYERKLMHAKASLIKVTDEMRIQLQSIASTGLEPAYELSDTSLFSNESNCSHTELGDSLKFIYPEISDSYYTSKSEDDSGDSVQSILDRIVARRIKLCGLSKEALPSQSEWSNLQYEIEEIETRALCLLTVPPLTEFDADSDGQHQLQILLRRLEEQATECLEKAHLLVSTPIQFTVNNDTVSSGSMPSGHETCVVFENKIVTADGTKPFPTLSEARSMVDATTHLLYPLLSDYAMQKQTLDVKRIIGCVCNQVTPKAAAHSLNRLNYLLDFLSGEAVRATVGGVTRNVRLSDLLPGELGSPYAWQCLFTVVLSQAEHQFVHNVDVAITFAAILSGILGKYQDRIPEFMARVFVTCPALALSHDPDAAASLTGDVVREESLPRWRGLARLIAALAISQPPPSLHSPRPDYLNPKLLWRIIAGLVNASFVPNGTAEVLNGLLEVGGFVLHRCYSRQMDRLLETIVSRIRGDPELRNSIPEISLLSTIEVAQKAKRFVGGKGFLDTTFWNSS